MKEYLNITDKELAMVKAILQRYVVIQNKSST